MSDELNYDEFSQDKRPPLTNESARELVRCKHRVRLALMTRDMRWLERVMRRLGFNPDDARWIP